MPRESRETEFTYDVANPEMLMESLRMIRRPLQDVLAGMERRVAESGRAELSRRYAPVWDEDIVRAVLERPRRLLAVLGDEAALVDAVITLGGARNLGLVKPFVRQVMATLRSFYDCDMRELAAPVLEEATRALGRTMDSIARQKGRGVATLRHSTPRTPSGKPSLRFSLHDLDGQRKIDRSGR